jgi:hypothetical protein
MNIFKNRNTVYSASRTSATGALFYREITALLPLLKQENFNDLLFQEVKENRYLQINAQSTRRRVINEIKNRLEYAFDGFFEQFEDSTPNEQVLMMFFLTLKSVPLIYDFHFDVTLSAWKGSSRVFDPFSYQMKLDEIGNGNETVREWAESTRKQILKVYKRMLKEAGFLKGVNLVKPVTSGDFFDSFIKNNELWFLEACFLTQTEREKLINDYKLRNK